jgi:hypothetical protein
MSQHDAAEFSITLEDGHIMPDGLHIYPPGAVVSGAFEIRPYERIPCRGVELQLRWRTEGKGDEDGAIINTKTFRRDELLPDRTFGDQFAFKLPFTPHSYAGQLINIVWMVSVKIDKPLARDIHFHQPLVMTPAAEE